MNTQDSIKAEPQSIDSSVKESEVRLAPILTPIEKKKGKRSLTPEQRIIATANLKKAREAKKAKKIERSFMPDVVNKMGVLESEIQSLKNATQNNNNIPSKLGNFELRDNRQENKISSVERNNRKNSSFLEKALPILGVAGAVVVSAFANSYLSNVEYKQHNRESIFSGSK